MLTTINLINLGKGVSKTSDDSIDLCIKSWDRFDNVKTVVWDEVSIEENKSTLLIPEEYYFLDKEFEEAQKNLKANELNNTLNSIYSYKSNILRICILAAAKKLDNADFRVYADTDVIAITNPEEWFEDGKGFIGLSNVGPLSAIVPIMGCETSRKGLKFWKKALDCIPGYLVTTEASHPVPIRLGSPYISNLVVKRPDENINLLPKDYFYKYNRGSNLPPTEKDLDGAKAIHLAFKSYAEKGKLSNEEVTDAVLNLLKI